MLPSNSNKIIEIHYRETFECKGTPLALVPTAVVAQVEEKEWCHRLLLKAIAMHRLVHWLGLLPRQLNIAWTWGRDGSVVWLWCCCGNGMFQAFNYVYISTTRSAKAQFTFGSVPKLIITYYYYVHQKHRPRKINIKLFEEYHRL